MSKKSDLIFTEQLLRCKVLSIAVSFDPLSGTVGKDFISYDFTKNFTVGLSDLSSVHVALEYPWKTEKKMGMFGLNDK